MMSFFVFNYNRETIKASFGSVFNREIKKALKFYTFGHFTIVLDNSRVHHSKFIKDSYLYKITHLFLPRYSPQLNPIELIW